MGPGREIDDAAREADQEAWFRGRLTTTEISAMTLAMDWVRRDRHYTDPYVTHREHALMRLAQRALTAPVATRISLRSLPPTRIPEGRGQLLPGAVTLSTEQLLHKPGIMVPMWASPSVAVRAVLDGLADRME